MKYTIEGFSQHKLIEFKLDVIDALILRWFVDFLPKMNTIIHDEKSYSWVMYQAIIDDLPSIGINNREVIARRFNKFIKCGIMEKYVNKINGTFIYFRLTAKYMELVEFAPPLSTLKSTPIDSKVDTPIDSKVDTKYSSIKKDSSTINTNCGIPIPLVGEGDIKIPLKKKENNNAIQAYDFWESKLNKQYDRTSDTYKARIQTIKRALSKYDYQTIINVIEYKITNPLTQNRELSSILGNYLPQNIENMSKWLETNKQHTQSSINKPTDEHRSIHHFDY